MAHLSMLQQKIQLVGLVIALKNDRKWAWLLKFCAQEYNRTPLQEILDPPLLYLLSLSFKTNYAVGHTPECTFHAISQNVSNI